jgi:pyruvate dehydrogenase E2 component (dihydrolipoamide acetyltransferase)
MAQLLEMPKLSDTMTEGVVRKWQKKEGDKIAPGDLVAEVETDKATMDFESFDEGVLLKLLVADGATVPVGAPIAILGKAGEDISAALAEAEKKKGGKAAAAPAAKAAPAPAAKAAPAAAPAKPASAAAPAAAKPAPAAAKPAPQPARPAPAPAATPANGASSGKILASPLARRLATDLGVDLRTVAGTGPGGRIVERDVKAAAERGPGAAPASGADEASVPRADASLPHPLAPERRAEARPSVSFPAGEDTLQPLSLMRKTIARRLVESKTQIPHFYLTTEADMEAAMIFREQVKEVHGAKLSVNDLIIKAAALALRRVPEANAGWSPEGDGIIRFGRVDVGMAVAIEDGLVTPVIRSADVKTLGQIAAEAQDLAKRARDRKLKPEDMTGGTFSISNLGMMGIKDFAAIINPPEAAILAVGAVRKEAVVKRAAGGTTDQIVIGQRMSMTLSCDHRVIDGALGAKLLQAIVAILERPITLAF